MVIRISYKKRSQIKFTSTLDMQKIWAQAMRRAMVQVEYSMGFHPQPRIQLGVPLPLGCTSLDEKVDIWIENTLSIPEVFQNLEGKLPDGIEITSITEVEPNEKPLASQIQYSDYKVYFFVQDNDFEMITSRIKELLSLHEIIRSKKNGKQYDLKPLIISLYLEKIEINKPFIFMRLSSQSNKTGRADQVMDALGFSITEYIIERIGSFS